MRLVSSDGYRGLRNAAGARQGTAGAPYLCIPRSSTLPQPNSPKDNVEILSHKHLCVVVFFWLVAGYYIQILYLNFSLFSLCEVFQ